MAAPTSQQMINACHQAVHHLQHPEPSRSAMLECDSDEGMRVEVFSTPHLAPGVSIPGDWYEVGILYSDVPGTALGVYLDAHSGHIKIEQPLLDVPSPSTAVEQDADRADDDGWNPWIPPRRA
jgi:hypothetical protein